ncbi:LsmAD [Gracilaria domingensis]|nr:LsmAD [Gracilaria domingensis]
MSRTPAPPVVVHELRGAVAKRVLIPVNCVSTLTAAMPDLTAARHDAPKRFATDGEISRPSVRAGRELKRFDDFDASQPLGAASRSAANNVDEQTFGDLANSAARSRNWDQFQVNRDKFGVNTTFDETEYTTKIDRSGVNFEQREREAQRMADEIERTESENVHLREERNQQLGNDFDEEARFSGVQRPPAQPVVKTPAQPRRSYLAAASGTTEQSQPSKPAPSVNKSASNTKHIANTANKGSTNNNANNKYVASNTKAANGNTKQHVAAASKQHSSAKGSQVSKSSGQAKAQVVDNKTPSTTAWSTTNASSTTSGKGKAHAPASKASAQSTKSSNSSKAASPNVSSTPTQGKETASAGRSNVTKVPAVSSAGSSERERATLEKQVKSSTMRERSGSIPQFLKTRNYISGRNSPNQSRNSPLPTSAVADTSAIGVLNLDAQTPNLGPEQIKRFEEYKTNREFQSIAANREKITDDLKKFSTQLDSRNGSIRRVHNSSTQTISRVSSNVSTASNPNPSNPSTEKPNVTNATTNSAVTSDKNNNNLVTTEKKQQGKDPVTDKKKRGEKSEENGPKKHADIQKSSEEPKQKPKSKFKLNPNAQEFKFNPDAPAFEPTTSKSTPQPSPAQPTGMVAPFPPGAAPPELSQQMPQPPQGYAMPMQPVAHMPYGGQPYVMMPGVHAAVPGSGAMGYPYIQGNQIGFPPGPVPGRYPPSPGVPVSYGGVYPPVAPLVMAQGPQRVPSSAYYYNPGPYAGGQGGNPNMAHHPGPHMFPQHQMGPGQMQGGMGGGPRGLHGNHRRGGPGKGRGKQYSHSHGHPNNNTIDRQSPTSPHGAATSEPGAR